MMLLQGHNPDVLSCIANLSNDEVFTPPEIANAMLDQVADTWAADNDGTNIWANPDVKFLDPFTKSGIFLREITQRLTEGLVGEIPDLQERVNHILTKQVYGIAITKLTGMLSRRSTYCSKWATRGHSICTAFDDDSGNIWYERTEHTWAGGNRESRVHPTTGEEIVVYTNRRCSYCGANEENYNRGDEFETHAYAFIHTDNIPKRLTEIFGETMQFDVVIGNPPYQLGAEGGTRDIPIYQHFIEQAKRLDPKLLAMIIPSRWMSTGLGLADFRREMLHDRQIRELVDYPNSQQVFHGVDVKGGVCYFVRQSGYSGDCNYSQIRDGVTTGPSPRDLSEHDVLVRGANELQILRKVLEHKEESVQSILSVDKQFGWTSNFKGLHTSPHGDSVPVYCIQEKRRQVKFIQRSEVKKSADLLPFWKLMVPKAASDGGKTIPDIVLGKPWLASAGSACTQSFLFFMFNSELEAKNFESYYRTRFFRFLVSLRKTTQDATKATYKWVPLQSLDREWTDEMLYEKYGITEDEIAFIESMIRPMEVD
ncbi:MAG: Eco57I restriction-modification methylase domain-containing protein [Actinomycetaceae bacterium]|nr:Eco57I restriction-modification methylase domain-containing protein [Actinomycetaceae bacterium]